MPTNERAADLMTDDRGAIMVMGIFMCSCLVGALWYLAGIGDAILYRERMQEAADAIAFSDAALHARGMNLIVMVNLIMAAILSVRVAIRVGKLACTVAAAIFAALSFIQPELGLLAAPAATAAETLDQVDRVSKPVIDGALQGLSLAQDGISTGTPPIAQSAADAVGENYRPAITSHTAFRVKDPFPVALSGLPVEHARPAKLCNEAAALLAEVQSWLVGKASAGTLTPAADVLGAIMQRLVALDTQYFCDLEGGASAPSTAAELVTGAKERCKDLGKLDSGEEDQRGKTEAAWLKRCSELGVTCQSRGLKNDPLPKGIQIGQPSDHEAFSAQQGGGGNEASKGTSNVAPMAVKDFRNGNQEGQFLGGVLGDESRLRKDSRLVRIGAFNAKQTPTQTDPENAKLPAWAQAEMFFDCGDTWTSEHCNGDDEAMWHFKWRPRLRRFNQPMSDTLQMLALKLHFLPPRNPPDVFADRLAQEALDRGSGFQANRALRVDLAGSIRDPATRARGVH